MATLTTEGRKQIPFKSLYLQIKPIGEEVVSWKNRVESCIRAQSPFVKTFLAAMTITMGTFSGYVLAQIGAEQEASSFDLYRSMRTAEVVVKESRAIPKEKSSVLARAAFDIADDYMDDIFGTPVPAKISAAEAIVKQPLKSPLLEVVDNGPPPVPQLLSYSGSTPSVSSRHLIWPMRGGAVTSRFGMRWGRMHQGTDIAAPHGTPILAAADGKVSFSGWSGGYGELIILDHGNGTKTKYGHCSKRLVSVGDIVRQGDVIGKVGNTGNSTGPHLHYEVIREGQAKNPESLTRYR